MLTLVYFLTLEFPSLGKSLGELLRILLIDPRVGLKKAQGSRFRGVTDKGSRRGGGGGLISSPFDFLNNISSYMSRQHHFFYDYKRSS